MRVLFVEDEPPARQGLTAILTDRAHEVDVAETADEAISQMRRHEYDVLLVDIMLPGGESLSDVPFRETGKELIVRLRRGDLGPLATAENVPVIAVTAVCDLEVTESLTRTPGVSVCPKPIDPEEIACQVERHLRGSG